MKGNGKEKVRIATYNVWNEEKGMGDRRQLIIEEILRVDADFIALQEITPRLYQEFLAKLSQYPYSEYGKYTNEEEGLAVLSKYPITGRTFLHTEEGYGGSCGLNVLLRVDGIRLSVTDVHLPWDSARVKEEQIVAIEKFSHEQKGQADYFVVLGDFNCGINSSVHRFMTGEQTIGGNEAKPYWYEVSSVYTAIKGQPLFPTLDCINNPRWKGREATYAPENFDRIYVMDVRNGYRFDRVELFGTREDPVSGLCASDHYGVMADVTFLK